MDGGSVDMAIVPCLLGMCQKVWSGPASGLYVPCVNDSSALHT
jgi:hypothetical protein